MDLGPQLFFMSWEWVFGPRKVMCVIFVFSVVFGRGRIRFPGLFCGWCGSGSYDPMSSVIGVRKLACMLFAFFRGHAWAAVSSIRVTHVLGLRVRTLMSFVFVFGARKFRFACYLHGLKHVRAALASASSAPKRGGFVVIFEWASELLFRGLRAICVV